ncbi:MAG: hypothetical protein ABL929_07060, partial [Ferruginibacter sp.]
MHKNLPFKFFVVMLLSFVSISNVFAQLTGTKNIPGDYADLAAAIADLNLSGVGAGGVTLNLVASNPQTAPAGGYVIGGTTAHTSVITGAAANPIFIVGNNNDITAPTPQASGTLVDGIFKIIGADYVTIDGFKMYENVANTTIAAGTNNMTEFGVALLYAGTTIATANGAQFNTIKNCVIDLDKTYLNTFGIYSNSTHTATAATVGVVPTASSGSNSGLTIIKNNISDVNLGIFVAGPGSATSGGENDGITIGGSATDGNTITNYGTATGFSGYFNVTGTIFGIAVKYSKNINVSYNTITSSVTGNTLGTMRGIYLVAGANGSSLSGTFSNNISNNVFSIKSALATGTLQGIFVESLTANATTTLNINNNDFNNSGHTVASSGAISCIVSTAPALTTNINYNTFTNLNVNTTASFTFISAVVTMPAGGAQNVNGNSIVGTFAKTGAGNTVILFNSNASSPTGTTVSHSNNNFSNISVTGATAIGGWISRDGASTLSGPVKTISNNTFTNWTGKAKAVFALTENAGASGSVVSNNTINNISGDTLVVGISVVSNSNSTFTNNKINTLSSTGTASAGGVSPVIGILLSGTSSTNNTPKIYKNKIYDLSNTNVGGTVTGIAVSFIGSAAVPAANTTIANNIIGDLRATAASNASADVVRGIEITSTALLSNVNVYYNSIYLNATSTGTNFATSGIYHAQSTTATTATLDLRNNIIVNKSTPNGLGIIAAFRRSAPGLDNYAATSNKNIFYAGTPSATNAIYYDGTTSYDFIPFQGLVAREANSFTEDVPFHSVVGSNPNFLKISSAVTTVANDGADVISITDDYDGDIRSATLPDIGADEITTALAISYSEFNGYKNGNENVLIWATSSETDNKGFALLRSKDGLNFTEISFVATKAVNGNSTNKLTYQYIDNKPLAGTNFYRLKQLDLNGKTTLSKIVELKSKKVNSLEIINTYPNPTTENINVIVSSASKETATIIVIDFSGKVMQTKTVTLVNGETNINVNV